MGDDIAYAFIGLALGGAWFFNAFSIFRQKKLIENTATSKIRAIAMGNVEIYGKVIPNKNDLVKSPFSGKDCAYCRWTVEEYRKSGKNSKWVTVKSGIAGSYFYVQDNTGMVLVEVKGATIEIPMDFETQKITEAVKEFCKNNAVAYSGILGFNRSMRFREYFLEKGDNVFVMGHAGDNPFVEDGTSHKNETDIMIQKGKGFYYISDKSEKEILKSFGWRVVGGFIGGGAVILICLFIIFSYFNIL